MEHIDLENWERKALLQNYFGTDFPYIAMCAEVDVASFYRWTKARGLSFYHSLVFAANHTANSIKNFRYRVDGEGKPYLIKANRAIFTHMQKDAELFCLVEVDAAESLAEFCRQAAEKAEAPIESNGWASIRNQADSIIYSAIPWVHFTMVTRTVTKGGYDCAPRITFGKYERQGEKLMMPVAVQVHHGLMDGYHVGLYYQRLQQALDREDW